MVKREIKCHGWKEWRGRGVIAYNPFHSQEHGWSCTGHYLQPISQSMNTVSLGRIYAAPRFWNHLKWHLVCLWISYQMSLAILGFRRWSLKQPITWLQHRHLTWLIPWKDDKLHLINHTCHVKHRSNHVKCEMEMYVDYFFTSVWLSSPTSLSRMSLVEFIARWHSGVYISFGLPDKTAVPMGHHS